MSKIFAIITLFKSLPQLILLWSKKSVDQCKWGQCIGDIMRSLLTLGLLKPESPVVIKNEKTIQCASSSACPAIDGPEIVKKKLLNPRECGSKI